MHNKQEEKFKKKHEQQEKQWQHLDNGNILRNAQKNNKKHEQQEKHRQVLDNRNIFKTA